MMNSLPTSNTDERHRLFSGDFVLLVLSSMLFFSSMYVYLNYLPEFVISLNGTQADVGLVTGAFVTSSLAVRPFVGTMIDRLGRKPVLLLGNLLFVIVPLLYSLPNHVFGLLLVRLLHGIGFSLFTTAGLTIVTDIASSGRRGEATSFFMSAQIVAIAIAPGLGSLLASERGLPSLIPIAAALGVASLAAAVALNRSHTSDSNTKVQWKLSQLIRIPGIAASGVASATVGLGYATIITFLPVVTSSGVMRNASLFYFVYAVVSLIVRTPAGRLSDRLGRRKVILPTIGLSSMALLLIFFAKGPLWMAIAALLYGVGFGSAYPVVGALAADYSPDTVRGSVMGFYAGSFDVGLLVGSVVGGAVGEYWDAQTIFAAVSSLTLLGLAVFYFMSSDSHIRRKVS
jgi:MFS family permease